MLNASHDAHVGESRGCRGLGEMTAHGGADLHAAVLAIVSEPKVVRCASAAPANHPDRVATHLQDYNSNAAGECRVTHHWSRTGRPRHPAHRRPHPTLRAALPDPDLHRRGNRLLPGTTRAGDPFRGTLRVQAG